MGLGTVAGCADAAPATRESDSAIIAPPGDSDLSSLSDEALIRAIADKAGPAFDLAEALEGSDHAEFIRAGKYSLISRAWVERFEEAEKARSEGGDPERPYVIAKTIDFWEIRRGRRRVGIVLNVGQMDSWMPPWRLDPWEIDMSDASRGSLIYFDRDQKIVTEVEWEQ